MSVGSTYDMLQMSAKKTPQPGRVKMAKCRPISSMSGKKKWKRKSKNHDKSKQPSNLLMNEWSLIWQQKRQQELWWQEEQNYRDRVLQWTRIVSAQWDNDHYMDDWLTYETLKRKQDRIKSEEWMQELHRIQEH